MAERKSILLRLDPAVHDALAKWAADEMRSTNAQIEFLLRRALGDAGRMPGGARQMRRPGRRPRQGRRPTRPADEAARIARSPLRSQAGNGSLACHRHPFWMTLDGHRSQGRGYRATAGRLLSAPRGPAKIDATEYARELGPTGLRGWLTDAPPTVRTCPGNSGVGRLPWPRTPAPPIPSERHTFVTVPGDRRSEVGRTLAEPVPQSLGLLDQFGLWGNLGVSLLGFTGAIFVLQPGGAGTPELSLAAALTAIVARHAARRRWCSRWPGYPAPRPARRPWCCCAGCSARGCPTCPPR